MFEQASRLKLRFETPKGALALEDLWELPLSSHAGRANLDDLAIALHHQLKNEGVSFVEDDTSADPVIQLKFELVKHVIKVRKEDKRVADTARTRAQEKQKILAIIAHKEGAELENKSLDELRALIAGL